MHNSYYQSISAYVNSFVYRYLDYNYEKFKGFDDAAKFIRQYTVSDDLLSEFVQFVEKKVKLTQQAETWKAAKPKIAHQIKALIAQQLFGSQAYFKVLGEKDRDLKKAIEELKK